MLQRHTKALCGLAWALFCLFLHDDTHVRNGALQRWSLLMQQKWLVRLLFGTSPLLFAFEKLQRNDTFSYAPVGTENAPRFYAPRTASAFAAIKAAHPNIRILAGSTDVGLWDRVPGGGSGRRGAQRTSRQLHVFGRCGCDDGFER